MSREFPWLENQQTEQTAPVQTPAQQFDKLPQQQSNSEFPWLHQELKAETAKMDERQRPVDFIKDTKAFLGEASKAITGPLGYGDLQASRAVDMSRVVQGQIKYDDIKDKYSPAAMDAYKKQNVDPYNDVLPFHVMRDWVAPTLETLPYIKDLTVNPDTLGFAGAGAATGAGVGLAAGALTPLELGEVVTVPGGALIGLKMGGTAGFAISAGKLGAGDLYANLREAGLSHEEAKPYAIAGGVVLGAVNTFQGALFG